MAIGSRQNFQSQINQTSNHHQANESGEEKRAIRDLDIKGFEQVTRGIRVLVVDDDASCVAIVAGILTKMKYQVVPTRSPIEALRMLRATPKVFDLILTDVHMPEMTGLELLDTCRKEQFDIPVVLMSGDTKGGIIARGLRRGALHCLTKPIDVFSLHKIWIFVYQYSREKAINAKSMAEAESKAEPAAATPAAPAPAPANPRKFRLRWSDDLHNKFVQVVNEIGVDNVRPSEIHKYLKHMVPNLTTKHISSHLQMHRKWLKNVQDGESSSSNKKIQGKEVKAGDVSVSNLVPKIGQHRPLTSIAPPTWMPPGVSAAAASLPPTTTTRPINQHVLDTKNNDRQVTNYVGTGTAGFNDPFLNGRADFFPPVQLSPDELADILSVSRLEENKFPDKVFGVPVNPYSTTTPTVPNQPIAGINQRFQGVIRGESSSMEFAADRTYGSLQQKIPNYEMNKTNTYNNSSSSSSSRVVVVADNKGKGIISEADDDELEACLSDLSSLFDADDDPMHGSSSWLSAFEFK